MIMRMIYSVNFHHVILMVMKVCSHKSFFIHNFPLWLLIPHFQMVMHWNEFCKENEIVEGGLHGH